MKAVRKLATACLAFSAAVFASNYILPVTWLPPGAVLCAALGVGLVFMRRKWLRGLIISLLAFSAGLLCFYGHYQRTSLPASRLDGVTAEVSGRLLEYPQVYEDYCRARIALQTEGMPRLDAVVYDSGGTLQDGVPGQTLSFTARITPADRRYGEPYDYYNAKDIYLTLNTRSDVVFSGEGGGLSTLPVRLARLITDKIREICPEDTAEFTVSLLLGDKSRLYEQEGLYLALSRAGLMHVVAVSGMHIAFLVSLLQLLLGRTRRSSLFCIALVWLFVLTAGASPSAVRAGVMQSLLLLAPVLDRENDAVTSLSFALGLLLLTNPYAAASVSLQLSFAAMAGLYGLSGRISAALLAALPEGRARTFLRRPVEIVGSSLSVMAFTVPLTALHFGTVSVLAPLTNCLCLWLVSICFCGGILSCALAALFPAAGICAAWLLAWPARAIFLASRLISALPFATLYMQDHFVAWWLLLCYGLVCVAVCSRAGVRFKILLPALLSVAVLAVNLEAMKLSYAAGRGVISVLDVGQGQCISVFSGDRTLLIDCGGLNTADNAGETAGAYLTSRGRPCVDVLLLTHLHADHANGVTMLMEMAEVKQLYIPANCSDDDGLLPKILESAERHGTEVQTVSEDELLRLDGITAQLYAPGEAGEVNERCVMTKVSLGDYDMLVTADSSKTVERALIESHPVRDVELLIAGHHGSRNACCGELLGSIGADTAVISVGYNSFGHPTYETLERLAAYGYQIYRTDLNGTVEFRIG